MLDNFEYTLKELKEMLEKDLRIAGIDVFFDPLYIPARLNKSQQELLEICTSFYTGVREIGSKSKAPTSSYSVINSALGIDYQLDASVRDAILKSQVANFISSLNAFKTSLNRGVLGRLALFINFDRLLPNRKLQSVVNEILKEISLNDKSGIVSKLYSKPKKDDQKQNETRVIWQPDHQNLIKIGQMLGYDLSNEGVCYGYTMRWIEASILKQQSEFLKRLNNIAGVPPLLNSGITLEELKTDPELKDILWDIKAFYESLYLYQTPDASIFARHVSQLDVDIISELASSDDIRDKGGIKASSILRYDEFSKLGLLNTMSHLEKQIKESQYQEPVCFLMTCSNKKGMHAMNLTYHPEDGYWQWMDINTSMSESGTSFYLADFIDGLILNPPEKYIKEYDIFYIRAVLPKANTTELDKKLLEVTKFESKNQQIIQKTLVLSAGNNDLQMVQTLLAEEDVDVNACIRDGATPLFIAVECGYIEIVKALLAEEDVDVNASRMSDAATPLFIAAQTGNEEIVKCLLEKGADRTKSLESSEDSLKQFAIDNAKGDDGLIARMDEIIDRYKIDNPASGNIKITPEQIAYIMNNTIVLSLFSGSLSLESASEYTPRLH